MIRFLPQKGFDSEYMQSIANKLPSWHPIRSDPAATGQYMVNALAIGATELHQLLKQSRKSLYLATTDTLARTHAYRSAVPQSLKERAGRSSNMLRNVSFRLQGQAWRNDPLEWQVTSGDFYPEDSYAGHGSIQLEPNGEAFQIVSGDQYHNGQTYTASVYTKSAAGDEVDNGSLTIQATGWGWTQEEAVNFQLGTSNEWVRQTVSILPTGEIRTFKVTVASQPTGEINVLLCAPMLSEGASLQTWIPGSDEIASSDFRLFLSAPTGETQQHIELVPVFNDMDLFEEALPNRIVTTSGHTGDIISDSFAPPVYELTKDVWDTEFSISGDNIIQRSIREPYDIWNTYSILDRYMDNEVNTGEYGYVTGEFDGFSRSLEALCTWRRRIYLVATESYGGNTYRVLKILRWQGINNRLETIHDVRIGMDTGDVSDVGFTEGRIDEMALTMSDDTEWSMSLYFDIFLYDYERRQVVLRHPYTGYTLNFSEL